MSYSNLSKEDYKEYVKLINSNITEEYFYNYIDNILNDNHQIIILKDNENKLIGSGTILIEEKLTYSGCKMGHIENVLIDEKSRGKGYGEILIKYLLEICKMNKCYRVDLNCNSELEKFYEKNNFKKKHLCMNIYFKENFH